jgi:hypothetical protein
LALSRQEEPVEGSDDETIVFDQLPALSVTKTAQQPVVTGTAGNVTFDIVVQNTGPVSLTLTSLTDTSFGDLTTATGTTCSLPQVIDSGSSYSCLFVGAVTGDESTPHQNTATAAGQDKDGNETSGSDDETVSFDQLPQIAVAKSADPAQVVGPTAEVNFTVIVTNTGAVAVTLTELTDSDFGDLNGQGSCVVPQADLAPSETYHCTFTKVLDAAVENPHQNTVTVTAEDKDGHEATGTDGATVVIALRGTLGNYVWLDDDKDGIQGDAEEGVAGVIVRLFRNNFDGAPIGTTTTDDTGAYLFTDLEAGTYCLEFTIPADARTSPADIGSDDAIDSDGVTVVDETTARTTCFGLDEGEIDLTHDLGVFDFVPTGEEPGEQPNDGMQFLYLPNLQASRGTGN